MESVRVGAPAVSATRVTIARAIVTGLAEASRGLPPRLLRALIVLDLLLWVLPPWAWLFYWRWTGVTLGWRDFARLWPQGLRFAYQHTFHPSDGTGIFSVDWSSTAVRRCERPERADHQPRGSCGTCTNCCETHWLPEAKRTKCPMLGERGCLAYGGVYWDFFNCGRYPAVPGAVSAYSCPRFEGILKPRQLPIAAPPAEKAA
jgi:hypothetical protein